MHYLYKVKAKVAHLTGVAGPVRFVDGESMWTNKNRADAAIGSGCADRVNGGPCDPYVAVMEIDTPPGIPPSLEDISMAMTGRWTPPAYKRIIRVGETPVEIKKQPEPVAAAPVEPAVEPVAASEKPAKQPAKKAPKFTPVGE